MIISIIMPVYNSAEHVAYSVASVLEQTHPSWELIIVNDGSTDETGALCDDYARDDDRIRVIHTNNYGPADARNTGLLNVSGAYCMFLDSDDYLNPQAIEVLQDAVSEMTVDLVFYGYSHDVYVQGELKSTLSKQLKNNVFSSNEAFKNVYDALEVKQFTHPVWNKLFKMSFLKTHAIQFPSGLFISEDFIFNLNVYALVEQVLILNEVLHHYVSRMSGSITTTFRQEKIDEMEQVYLDTSRIMQQWQPSKMNYIYNEYIQNISVYINSLYNPECLLATAEKALIIEDIVNRVSVEECLAGISYPIHIRNLIIMELLRKKNVSLLMQIGRLSRRRSKGGRV